MYTSLQYKVTQPMVRFVILVFFYLFFNVTYQVAYCTFPTEELFLELLEMERTYLRLRLDRIESYYNSYEFGQVDTPLYEPPISKVPSKKDPSSPTMFSSTEESSTKSGSDLEEDSSVLDISLPENLKNKIQPKDPNSGVKVAEQVPASGPGVHVTLYGHRDQNGEFSADMAQTRADMKSISIPGGNTFQRIFRSLFTHTKMIEDCHVTVDMQEKMNDGSYKSLVNEKELFSLDQSDLPNPGLSPPKVNSPPVVDSSPDLSTDLASSSLANTCDSPSQSTFRTICEESSGIREVSPSKNLSPPESPLSPRYQNLVNALTDGFI